MTVATTNGQQREVQLTSDGLQLSGLLDLPHGAGEGRRPAVIVLHGFGGNKEAETHRLEAEMYAALGYVTLRIDFRGCGKSEGSRGRTLCEDAVADVRNALTWLADQPEVDPGRIAVSGQSYGGAVAIRAAGVDDRIAAVVSIGGWGNGLSKLRRQHAQEGAWARFTAMLDAGRDAASRGEQMMVPRWDIVPIPEHLRSNLPPSVIMEFPVEVAQSMMDFRPEDVVAQIAPRPLLLIHAAQDSVTPSEQSLELMRRAGQGAELVMFDKMDHFAFASGDSRLRHFLREWLETFFPL